LRAVFEDFEGKQIEGWTTNIDHIIPPNTTK